MPVAGRSGMRSTHACVSSAPRPRRPWRRYCTGRRLPARFVSSQAHTAGRRVVVRHLLWCRSTLRGGGRGTEMVIACMQVFQHTGQARPSREIPQAMVHHVCWRNTLTPWWKSRLQLFHTLVCSQIRAVAHGCGCTFFMHVCTRSSSYTQANTKHKPTSIHTSAHTPTLIGSHTYTDTQTHTRHKGTQDDGTHR